MLEPFVLAGAEVGMEADGGADEIEEGGGIGVDGIGGDVAIPEIVGWGMGRNR